MDEIDVSANLMKWGAWFKYVFICVYVFYMILDWRLMIWNFVEITFDVWKCFGIKALRWDLFYDEFCIVLINEIFEIGYYFTNFELCFGGIETGIEILRMLVVLDWFVNHENSELYWERWFDVERRDCDLYFWEMLICVVVDPWQMSIR